VHARTKTEGYRPPAHWDWIARIREAVTVNVVANGEIWTLQDAQRCLEISGSQDLMLGRGLVARPDLAGQIASWASGRPEVVLDWPGMRLVVTQFWGLLQAYADGAYPQARLKQWLALVAQAFPAARPLLESVRRQPDSHSVAACLADDTYWQVGR
jgi:tRNA-dihydrouridine synthase C